MKRAEQTLIERVPKPGLRCDASVEPIEHRFAVGAFGGCGKPEQELRFQARQETFIARGRRMVKLVDDDDVEGVGFDIVDAAGERLHRGKDVMA